MKFSLKDGAPRKPGEAELFVSKNANTLEIGLVGQEEHPPIVIEHYDGWVKLRVYDNQGKEVLFQVLDLADVKVAETMPVGASAFPDEDVVLQPKRMVSLQPVKPISDAPPEPVSTAKLDPERGMYYGRNLTPEQIELNRQIIDGSRVPRPTPITQAEVNATLAKGTNGKPQHVYGGRPGYQGVIDPYADDND